MPSRRREMMQLSNGSSEFADLNQTGTAAIIDFFPWLRKLPEFLVPAQQKTKDPHKTRESIVSEPLVASKGRGSAKHNKP